MTGFTTTLAAAAAIGALAAPAVAQNPYPYGYPQQPTYPQQYPQGYGQPGYAYGQATTGNPITDIIDSLLGNRYNVTDRQAVRQCANAARAQAAQKYGQQYNGAYGGAYNQGYNNGYGQAFAGSNLRVTAITEVQRRSNGLRVSGTLGSGAAYANPYGNQSASQYGYQNREYAAAQLSFRCNVDTRGAVTGLRVRPVNAYRG